MICTILEAQKGFKIDNWGFFSHQEILIWHRTNTASCTQCMGPVRDTAERKKHDQTANYSNQVVVFKVPASVSDIFGSRTGQCWWCLVQLPWKGVWWRRQPQPMIWCDKYRRTRSLQRRVESWAQKVLLYQTNELLPGMCSAPGPRHPCARWASSSSKVWQCRCAHAGSSGWRNPASHKSCLIMAQLNKVTLARIPREDWGQVSLESCAIRLQVSGD